MSDYSVFGPYMDPCDSDIYLPGDVASELLRRAMKAQYCTSAGLSYEHLLAIYRKGYADGRSSYGVAGMPKIRGPVP